MFCVNYSFLYFVFSRRLKSLSTFSYFSIQSHTFLEHSEEKAHQILETLFRIQVKIRFKQGSSKNVNLHIQLYFTETDLSCIKPIDILICILIHITLLFLTGKSSILYFMFWFIIELKVTNMYNTKNQYVEKYNFLYFLRVKENLIFHVARFSISYRLSVYTFTQ